MRFFIPYGMVFLSLCLAIGVHSMPLQARQNQEAEVASLPGYAEISGAQIIAEDFPNTIATQDLPGVWEALQHQQ